MIYLKHLISLHLFYRSARSFSSSGSTQVNFTARECFVTRFATVDAHIALTAKGAKDGLNFPRFTRAFKDTRNHPGFAMPGIEQINKTSNSIQQMHIRRKK